MAYTYIDTNQLGDMFTLLVQNGDTTEIAAGVRIQTDDPNNMRLGPGNALTMLVNGGLIVGENSNAAIEVQGTLSNLRNTGTIANYSAAAADGAIQYDDTGQHYISNTGTILALGRVIDILGPPSGTVHLSVVNDGLMESLGANDLIVATSTLASTHLINNGRMVGGDLNLASATSAILFNTGQIFSTRIDGASGSGFHLTNTGQIRNHPSQPLELTDIFGSDGSTGDDILNQGDLFANVSLLAGADELVNAAHIHGDIDLGDGNDAATNTGTLHADIDLGAGNDWFDTRGGQVLGVIEGGLGNDTFLVDDATLTLVETAGAGTDTVQTTTRHALAEHIENLTLIGASDATGIGNDADNTLTGSSGSNRLGAGTGDDTLVGGLGNDTLYGSGGNDSLSGGDGDDYLSAGTGADTLFGGDGDDRMLGRRGLDKITGDDGADWIDGGNSDDTLLGGREDDTLIGGAGADFMEGNAGNDTFVWRAVGDSPDTGANDTVSTFEVGLDQLDFSAFDLVDIHLDGSFTGDGMASVRTFQTSSGNTRVFVDSDGDGTSEMRIDLTNTVNLQGSDFIL